jgi:hypothetical protein
MISVRTNTLGRWVGYLWFLGLFLGSAAGPLPAQDMPLQPRKKIRESVRRKPPLAGPDVRVGVMAFERESPIYDDYVFVWLPESTAQVICVSLTSIDGIYEARVEYDFPSRYPRGRVRLHLTSEAEDVIRRYTPERLAILARLGTDCERGETGPFLLASWSPQADPRTAVVLLAARADWTVIAGIQPATPEIRCLSINDPTALEYDARCLVRIAPHVSSAPRFQVRRRHGRTRLDDVDIPIAVP